MLTVLLQDSCLRVYTAILELDKSLGSADVIFFADLTRVKKKHICTAGYLDTSSTANQIAARLQVSFLIQYY